MPSPLISRRRYVRYLALAATCVLLFTLYNLSLDSSAEYPHGRFPGPPPPYHKSDPDKKTQILKSSYDWSSLSYRYPVSSLTPLPTGQPLSLPSIQHKFAEETPSNIEQLNKQRDAVQKAFKKCWRSYKQFAWMRDELAPISGGAKDPFGGWAATLIDALDTLWIMGLKEEFHEAVEAVAVLDWAKSTGTSCNVFETTIRHLGGLLSAYDLSQEEILKVKAVELGDMLMAAFDTPNHMPPFWLDFEKAKSGLQLADVQQPSASPCSLSLEFTRLSQITSDSKYYDAIARITNLLDRHQNSTRLPGMWPIFINSRSESFEGTTFTLGALADSLYEYLPKTYVLLSGLEPIYKKLYLNAIEPVQKHLLFRPMLPDNADILFSGTANIKDNQVVLDAEGQHLGCFVGGMFALGGKLFNLDGHVDIGARLARGCMYAYGAFPSGIMPEIFNMIPCESLEGCKWDEELWKNEGDQNFPKGFKNVREKSYILRPEAIESVFLLYRITGLVEFRDAAWKMFESIQQATDTVYGNAAIDDVNLEKPKQRDSMESFWMAETLKYFYLIFSPPDLISLDDYVFNTEAHPLKYMR